jgi:hypothetical protein
LLPTQKAARLKGIEMMQGLFLWILSKKGNAQPIAHHP